MTVGFKCFINEIVDVSREAGTDTFTVTIGFIFLSNSPSHNEISFSAPWGSDWRLMARSAITAWILENLGEAVDGVVFPDLIAL
jgi:hypothetical protein